MKNPTLSIALMMLLAVSPGAEPKLISLGTLGGDFSSASAINDRGEVVGESTDANEVPHAFYYRDGVLRSLDRNPSEATAINDAGQVVGCSLRPSTNILILLPPPLFTNVPPLPITNIIVFTNPIAIPTTNLFPIIFLPTNVVAVPWTNIFVALPTNAVFGPGTNIIWLLPTNIIVPPTLVLISWTNGYFPFPTMPPLTNGILLLGTNIVVPSANNRLSPASNVATQEGEQILSGPVAGIGLTTNESTVTNVLYSPAQPAWFRGNSLVNLFSGANFGEAMGINDRGEIVGNVSENGGLIHAFVYRNGLMTDLGSNSDVTAINNHGDVVGTFPVPVTNGVVGAFPGPPQNGGITVPFPEHPCLYHAGLIYDLGTLGGDFGGAAAINDLGEIVGSSTTTSNAETHAFVYRNGTMTDLGTLGGTQSIGYSPPQGYSSALAINNWGVIVGTSSTTNGNDAFLYRNGTMTDLNDLVTLTYINGPAGFLELTSANGINDRGQIVGEGFFWDGASMTTRAFLLELSAEQVWPDGD
jgi:probable HAF family extracellular repeat protein